MGPHTISQVAVSSIKKNNNNESGNFVLTAEALNKALHNFHFSTQAVHADDLVSPQQAIAPALHSAVNYRYARDLDNLKGQRGLATEEIPGGHSPVFSTWLKTAEHAKRLSSKLYVFQHATSLGGVESLCEWRAMSSQGEDQSMLRVSVRVEDLQDIKADFTQAFKALLTESS
ncbi:hypothetical protein FSARC_8101 [Fusarium sarcochroum]|uniref:Cystathionine gamma-synthase n=1 Tax=Fusarium sarcochroum TaxID=1208366 RepID=A0A8H4TU29_9HYPO|nr:hypothetical protein FSARC_8101 [Fusarium sarcochroum]